MPTFSGSKISEPDEVITDAAILTTTTVEGVKTSDVLGSSETTKQTVTTTTSMRRNGLMKY